MSKTSPSTQRRGTQPASRPAKARASRVSRALQAGSGPDLEERIYASIFDGVMNHRLPPGTRLPEVALCTLFGSSRAVVRKVLQRLAHDRIVEHRPNRGAVIAAPTPEETRQIFEARRALEATLVELAVRRNAGKDLSEIYALLETERRAIENFHQAAWARLAANFHLGVAALGGNPILLSYLTELISRCALIVALYEPAGNATCEHEEHSRIVEAIARGDAPAAVAEMDAHLQALEARIRLDRTPSPRNLGQMLGVG